MSIFTITTIGGNTITAIEWATEDSDARKEVMETIRRSDRATADGSISFLANEGCPNVHRRVQAESESVGYAENLGYASFLATRW